MVNFCTAFIDAVSMAGHESTVRGSGQNPALPFPLACALDQRAKNSFYTLERRGREGRNVGRKEERKEEGKKRKEGEICCRAVMQLTKVKIVTVWSFMEILCYTF